MVIERRKIIWMFLQRKISVFNFGSDQFCLFNISKNFFKYLKSPYKCSNKVHEVFVFFLFCFVFVFCFHFAL